MKTLLLLVLLGLATFAWASEDNYSFADPAQRATFLRLTENLRCPMCQNQNIADSNAMISHDMRRKVYNLLQEGKSEQEVINYMKQRYGDFVYYNPPVNSATVWLWAIPILFVFVGLGVMFLRKRKQVDEDITDKLAQADKLLEQEK